MSQRTHTYRMVCLSKALSPVTHAAGAEGNEQIVATEPVRVGGMVRSVPYLSGNAIRHRLARGAAALYLADAMKLAGAMTLEQLNMLFHGGALTGGAAGRLSARHIADMYRLFPVLRLLGGSLPNQIVPGHMIAERGTLVCRENRERITKLLPPGFELPSGVLPAAASCVARWQYTRRDVADTQPELAAEAIGETGRDAAASSQMIFAGQSVIAGSLFYHGFICQNVTELELGALLHSILRWQRDGGTIGGQSARGHGRLHLMAAILPSVAQADCIAQYERHVAAHASECRAFLDTVFTGGEKPKRGKKQKPEAADAHSS